MVNPQTARAYEQGVARALDALARLISDHVEPERIERASDEAWRAIVVYERVALDRRVSIYWRQQFLSLTLARVVAGE